jgi:hypothetical protein
MGKLRSVQQMRADVTRSALPCQQPTEQEIPRFSDHPQTEDFFTTYREMKKSRQEETMLGDVFVWRTPDEHIAQ